MDFLPEGRVELDPTGACPPGERISIDCLTPLSNDVTPASLRSPTAGDAGVLFPPDCRVLGGTVRMA